MFPPCSNPELAAVVSFTAAGVSGNVREELTITLLGWQLFYWEVLLWCLLTESPAIHSGFAPEIATRPGSMHSSPWLLPALGFFFYLVCDIPPASSYDLNGHGCPQHLLQIWLDIFVLKVLCGEVCIRLAILKAVCWLHHIQERTPSVAHHISCFQTRDFSPPIATCYLPAAVPVRFGLLCANSDSLAPSWSFLSPFSLTLLASSGIQAFTKAAWHAKIRMQREGH